MAKIIFADGSEIRGRVGGKVYSRNASGAYVRKYTKPVNPNTALQNIARNQFSTVSQAYRDLTDVQRQSFEDMRIYYKTTDSVGTEITPTASQLFARLNGTLLQNGIVTASALLTTCPTPVSMVAVSGSAPEYQVANTKLFLNADFGAAGVTVPTDCILAFSATSQMSAGIKSPKSSAFTHLGYVPAGGDTSALDFSSEYTSVYGTPSGGQSIWVGVVLISTLTGQMSNEIKVKMDIV